MEIKTRRKGRKYLQKTSHIIIIIIISMPPPASEEQVEILRHLESSKHVIVDAVAGSGKSTTVLHVAHTFSSKRILQLTYNASLRQELKEKVREENISNLEVHTYHSFAVKYYSPEAFTDFGLRKILLHNVSPPFSIPPYDIVVLDEVQDMTWLYFRFVEKFTRDMMTMSSSSSSSSSFQMLILGDYKQSLYEFKGSDVRFLTMADHIWHPRLSKKNDDDHDDHDDDGHQAIESSFVRTSLRTSYRITHPMSRFLNETMLGHERLCAARDGDPVSYIRQTEPNIVRKILFEINQILESKQGRPEDIFILAGSMKMALVRKLENQLVESGIPCNIPMMEQQEAMDERVIQGKIVFSSFHCVKGRQRPYVFILQFSQKYLDTMCRDEDHDECPNTLYVGCTRATKRLFVFEVDDGMRDGPCKFLKRTHREMMDDLKTPYVKFEGLPKNTMLGAAAKEAGSGAGSGAGSEGGEGEESIQTVYTSATDLVRFVSEESFDILMPLLETCMIEETKAMDPPLEIPVVQECSSGNFEEISDINGLVIPVMYFDKVSKTAAVGFRAQFSSMEELLHREMNLLRTKNQGRGAYGRIFEYLQKLLQSRKTRTKTRTKTSDYLYLGNAYIALKERLFFKLHQIQPTDYHWLKPATIKKCFQVLRDAVPLADDSPGSVSINDQEEEEEEEEKQEEKKKDREKEKEKMAGATAGATGATTMTPDETEWRIEDTILDVEDEEVHAILQDQLERAGGLFHGSKKRFRLTARVDLVTSKFVYEIKCTTQLTVEHMLQLCIYAWIWRTLCHLPPREFKLLNIRSGQRYRLEADDETLCKIAHTLLQNKCSKRVPLTMEEFLEKSSIF
jgi:hypothetical protein